MTFISYPDIIAVSQNRMYRVEITGLSANDDFFRDQSGFVYRLVHARTGDHLWAWKPAELQRLADYPRETWVSDEGWVVVLLREWSQAGILVLSPNGELRMLRFIRSFGEGEAGFLDDEPDVHIGESSAGPHWDQSSIAIFHQHQGRPFWSILTWWARRIVVDLGNGTILDEVPSEQSALVADIERSLILDRLRRSADGMPSEQERGPLWWQRVIWPTYTAAYHAGLAGIVDAAPFLRSLESSPLTGYCTRHSWIALTHLPLRLIAKMSLLRLGVEPQWFANFVITSASIGARCSYPVRRICRIEDAITQGISQRSLLEQVGAPEFIDDQWDYGFIDGRKACTIRVYWHDKHKKIGDYKEYREAIERDPPVAERIERIDRPPWAVDPIREYSVAHCG